MAALGTLDILDRLVAYPTVSQDSNLPLIDWVRNYLADHGVDSHLVRNTTGDKSNLFATVGPLETGGIVLSGHTDVVPIDDQHWSSDPFNLTFNGSRFYGRGTCDMKGFIAVALSRVPVWQASKLRRPIHFMLSYDEELGCLGAPSMIEAANKVLPTPTAVIVGEPTGMRIATEHKGICMLRTRVEGIEAHSSLTHEGHSAVMLAGQLIAHLGDLAQELAANTNSDACRFTPPYTTLSVNRIEGGTASNILAAACEFGWEIRSLPSDIPRRTLEKLSDFAEARLGELLKEGKRCAIETEVLTEVPPLKADGGRAEDFVRSVGAPSKETIAVPFATEGGQFQRMGWSTVVCGPGRIEQAHKPDEFIEHAELIACEAFLDRVGVRQCRQAEEAGAK